MTELLKSIWIIAKWFFLEFVPTIITAPLGPLGELKDTISILKWLAAGLLLLAGIIIRYTKKHT